MAGENHRLEVNQAGPASFLRIGDKFVFSGNVPDGREHSVTQDLDSHFEYDGRPNKKLSKDTSVVRVGAPDPGENTERVLAALANAIRSLEQTGDVATWAQAVSDVISRAVNAGMDEDIVLSLEKLEKQGSAVFARARAFHGKAAAEDLNVAVRKRWAADVNVVTTKIRGALLEDLRLIVRSVILGV